MERKQAALDGTGYALYDVERRMNQQSVQFMADLLPTIRELYPDSNYGISVLDVGSRTGSGAALLADLHNSESNAKIKMAVTALDIADTFKPYATVAYPDLEYRVGNIFEIEQETWHLVICSHTIEHVHHPEWLLQRLRKLARQYVILACPFEEKDLIPGHVSSISRKLLTKYKPVIPLRVYDGMCCNVQCCVAVYRGTGKST